MGWGTTLTTDIYYNRKSYNSLFEVEDDLKEEQNYIDSLKNELRMLVACTDPQKMLPQDQEWEPLEWLKNKTDQILSELEIAIGTRNDYQTLIDVWDDCHKDGVARACPDGMSGSYLEGDFVKTDRSENEDDEN